MKSRFGFISNSSSCSFVCIGYKMEYNTENILKLAEAITGIKPENEEEANDTVYDSPVASVDSEDAIYVGFTIEIHDDEEMGETNIDIETILEKTNELKNKLGITDKIKLFTGVRAC